jgi:hypothetical protein
MIRSSSPSSYVRFSYATHVSSNQLLYSRIRITFALELLSKFVLSLPLNYFTCLYIDGYGMACYILQKLFKII